MANGLTLTLIAWLGNGIGRRGYFVFSLAGFTLASVLCGMAPNGPLLVTARIIQGLLGGGLLAKSQAILVETIPKDRQGFAQAVFGLGTISGPALGPTVAGFLTDLLSWRWIVLINLSFGSVAPTITALLRCPAFIWWELRHPNPAVQLRVFRHRSLAAVGRSLKGLGLDPFGALSRESDQGR